MAHPARGDIKVLESPAASALSRSVEEYLDHVGARRLSLRTTEHYGWVLRRVLVPWCDEQKITDPGQLDQRALDRLSTWLISPQRGLTPHSAHSYLRSVNHYLSWLRSEGEVPVGVKAQTPRLPKKLVDVLSREEIQQLEDAAATERDKLMIRVMADTGMRLGELLGLTGGSLVERGRREFYLKVKGKGDKERLVAIRPGLHQRLRRFIERSRPQDALTDNIFVGLRRRTRGEHRGERRGVRKEAVERMIHEAAYRAGLAKPARPHVLRHSFVTEALRRGVNPVTLAQIVGHSDLSMISRVYSHLSASDTHTAMMKMLSGDDD
ncbi:MAG: tyrosine-type recombinase/integrase [Candidatus Dormibacterales bacterium]